MSPNILIFFIVSLVRTSFAVEPPNPIFDEAVYQSICFENATDFDVIAKPAAALIHNASRMLTENDDILAEKLLATYHKMLLSAGEVTSNLDQLKKPLADLDVAFRRFHVDPSVGVAKLFNEIPVPIWTTTEISTVIPENVELNNFEFSSAILFSTQNRMYTGFFMAVLGYQQIEPDTKILLTGVQLTKTLELKLFNYTNIAGFFDDNSQFAAYVKCPNLISYSRYIFVVYPLALTPFPKNFPDKFDGKFRQVDVYVDLGNDVEKRKYHNQPTCENVVNVYMDLWTRPDVMPWTGCASWEDKVGDWVYDRCTLQIDSVNWAVYCSCKIAKRSVTRIAIYSRKDRRN